jgi:four helix bundle protein
MRYSRFEQLPVWQAAIELAVQIYRLTSQPTFKSRYSLRDQLERAAVSVSNNIAEGFERGTTKELLTFLYIARGSAGEVRSMLCLFEFLSVFDNLKSHSEGVSRQLRAWADSLQNSEIRGQRYLTNKGKHSTKEAQEREEFLNELRKVREDSKPAGKKDE